MKRALPISVALWTLMGPAIASDPIDTRLLVAADSLLAAAFPTLHGHLKASLMRYQVTASGPLQLRLPPTTKDPIGHLQVDVWVADAQQLWRKVGWALFFVARYDSVVVARRTLQRGDNVSGADLAIVWQETTRLRTPPLSPQQLRQLQMQGPLEAMRRITAGEVLRADDLKPPRAAATGETVWMRYRRGALELLLRCQARMPGYVGDEIELYAPQTQATYRARLTAPGWAEWIATLQASR
ncbi:hypothetical protein HRbin18_00464 [bacterium HR18]|uniref:Flagella basal body P-ring formation protein FlgA n=1 Tax=Rhodothermus marinus TaxID=29549 RepID=A0A7V2F6D6_RHOMR|nr:hypothetical protein HRbin18_00464 [bacterium HR18]